MEIKKAKISNRIEIQTDTKTFYGHLGKLEKVDIQDANGIYVIIIPFDFKDSGQSMQIAIDNYHKGHETRIGTATGMELIIRMMKLFDVENFSDISGKYAYALYEDKNWDSYISGIMNPYTKEYIIVNEVYNEMKSLEWSEQ